MTICRFSINLKAHRQNKRTIKQMKSTEYSQVKIKKISSFKPATRLKLTQKANNGYKAARNEWKTRI